MQDERFSSQFARMSEVGRYQVAEEDPDPRGWPVISADGARIGEVSDLIVDPSILKVRYFEIEANTSYRLDDPRVIVDAQQVDLDERDKRVILSGVQSSSLSSLQPSRSIVSGHTEMAGIADDRESSSRRTGDRDSARLTRSEEELRIGKREVEAGEMVVNKTVETEQVREPVERRVERVRVERRPVTDASGSTVEIRDDEIRVPIVEEEIVVEKRPVVKEEIVLTRDTETETDVIEESVRKERVDVREEGKPRGGRHGRH